MMQNPNQNIIDTMKQLEEPNVPEEKKEKLRQKLMEEDKRLRRKTVFE